MSLSLRLYTLCMATLLLCRSESFSQSRQHPFLLMDKSGFQKVRREIADSTWKLRMWQTLQKQADGYLSEPVEIPPRGGNWDHYYFSPSSGYPLQRGNQTGHWQWEHLDPVTGEKFMGDTSSLVKDLDGVVIGFVHDVWALGVLQLGLAYQVSGNKQYADKAKEILLAYAALYPTLPVRDKFDRDTIATISGRGQIHVQSLNESIWLTDMVLGADLVWETLSPAERSAVVKQLLLPAADVINDNQSRIHNIQCWKNTAMGLTGLFLQDKALCDKAIMHPLSGYYAHLEKGFTKEGIWEERTASYQFFAMEALVLLAEAAQRSGYDARINSFHRMFRGPLLMASATKWIPAFNDAQPVNLADVNYLYEWAYHHFKDSAYAPVIHSNRGGFINHGPRFAGWGLLFGETEVPAGEKYLFMRSRNFSDAGIGLLSAGQGKNNLSFYLKYAGWSGPHSHLDELSFAMLKGDEHISIVPGIENYSSPLAIDWYKTSMAHNTFVINRLTQQRATAQCLAFENRKGMHYIMSATDNAYKGTRFVRSAILLDANKVLIVDQFQSEQPQLLDILYHQGGVWDSLPASQEWTPPKTRRGYRHLSDTKITEGLTLVHLRATTSEGRKVMVSAATDSPMEVITGVGKQYMKKEVPMAIFSRNISQGVQAWCISLDGKRTDIQLDIVQDAAGNALAMSKAVKVSVTNSSERKINVVLNPGGLEIKSDGTISKELMTYRLP